MIVDPTHPGPVIIPQITQYPHFVADLLTYPPSSLPIRAVVQLDGYAAVGDGGQGTFYWNANYTGPSTPLTIIPTGSVTTGAWCREIGADNVILATWFGAKGNVVNTSSITSYTDDTKAIQAMLDYNNLFSSGASGRQYVCKLPATSFQAVNGLVDSRTNYRITSPLCLNDLFIDTTHGNTTQQFIGEPGAWSGLYHREFLGPGIVCGNAGLNTPSPQLDPNGSGEWLMNVGQSLTAAIAVGSNGQTLPQGIIHVNSTAGFQTAGQFFLNSITGAYLQQYISYTGISGNTFTGCTGGTATMATGDTITTYTSPQWSLADYNVNDLTGFTNFTVEFFINPCNSTAWINSVEPAHYIDSPFGCGGSIGTVVSHRSMYLQHTNVFGPNGLSFTLTTLNGSFVVQTDQSQDHGWVANTLNHIAISYDGAHLRMFVNGAQPDASMTIAATGALDQRWYESITLCSGASESWPVMGQSGINQPAPPVMLGKFRFSNIARYTAPFTAPLPSTIICDTNSRLYLDFAPRSIPSRPSLRTYNIAQCGQGSYGAIVDGYGFPVWLNNHTVGPGYTSGARIEDMFFFGAGEGIHGFAATDAKFGKNCFFLTNEQGIIFDDFSYNSGVGGGCTFWQCGAVTSSWNYLSAEIIFGPGSQFSYIEDGNSSAFGSCNWGVVGTFADVTIGTCFPNSYHQGTYAFVQNVSTIYMNGATMLDDESAGFKTAGLLFAPQVNVGAGLTWNGGYIGMDDTLGSDIPVILIGTKGVPVTLNTTVFTGGCPIFSFQGSAATTAVPVLFPGTNPQNAPLIDPAHPGPVIVPQQQLATTGVNVLTFGADPTGATDSYGAFVNAIKFASSQSVPLFVPYGTYNISRYIAIENEITIEGAVSSNGFSGATQQPTIEGFIYGGDQSVGGNAFWGGTWMGPLFTVVAPGTSASSPVGYTHNHNIYKAQVGGINGVDNYPIMFLSETGCSSINGLAAMTVEYAFNFHTMDASNATPWCGGAMSDFSPFTTTFQV